MGPARRERASEWAPRYCGRIGFFLVVDGVLVRARGNRVKPVIVKRPYALEIVVVNAPLIR